MERLTPETNERCTWLRLYLVDGLDFTFAQSELSVVALLRWPSTQKVALARAVNSVNDTTSTRLHCVMRAVLFPSASEN